MAFLKSLFPFLKNESKDGEISFSDLFDIENKPDEYKFDIDLEKGLYIGAGVKLVGSDEDRFKVKPIFIDWGDLAGHLAVYGTTRVGKTRLMVSIIRQCILKGMDVLVIEPKGAVSKVKDKNGKDLGIGQETLGWILEFAEEAGRLRDIVYISPKFPEFSKKFNPLFGMSNEEIASLIATIIPAKDEFFITMGYQITMAVLLGLEFLEIAEGSNKVKEIIEQEYKRVLKKGANIVDELLKVSRPDLAERLANPSLLEEQQTEIKRSNFPYRSLVTFADIAKYATQDGVTQILERVKIINLNDLNLDPETLTKLKLIKNKAFKAKEEAERILEEMSQKDKQYYSKVSSSFNNIMSQLSSGKIGEIFCSVKINPIIDRMWDTDRGQIIIVQPFPLIFKKASDAFVRIFFSMYSSFYGNIGAAGRTTPREFSIFVDEGGAVLFPGIEHLFNKGGGLGLRLFIFTQSFADYKSELGEEIASIVNDNTNIKIYMRMNDNASREEVAKSFGKIKEASPSYMGSKLDMRINTRQEEKDILLPAHMGDMQKQEFLLQFGKGRFYCVAPFQPDPKYLFKMPKVETEQLYENFASRFRAQISEISLDVNEELKV